jgi:hypothetical protein
VSSARDGETSGRGFQNTHAASASAVPPATEERVSDTKPVSDGASVLQTLRARALGLTHAHRIGRRAFTPVDIVAAARGEQLKSLTLVGEVRATSFGHGFELCVQPLRVGFGRDGLAGSGSFDASVNGTPQNERRASSFPDRVLCAGAFSFGTRNRQNASRSVSFVKPLRSADASGTRFGYADTALRSGNTPHDDSEDEDEDCAFNQDQMGSSFRAHETFRLRVVSWRFVKNSGVASLFGLDAYDSDDELGETGTSQTSHACLSTSLTGDGESRDTARPPGGCCALTVGVGGTRRARLTEQYKDSNTHFFAAGDSSGRFGENTRPGFFDADVSPTGTVACCAESFGLLLYDVRDGRAVGRVERPKTAVRFKGDAVAVACDVRGGVVDTTENENENATENRRNELFAVGLRCGTICTVDTRTPSPSYFKKSTSTHTQFNFCTDLKALRAKPGTFVAASADGGLRLWDVRQTGSPVFELANGSPLIVFDTKRRCAVDTHERVVVFDQTHVVRALPGRPSTKREVESVAVWDLETGKRVWRREKNVDADGDAEVASAVAVETTPGVRVWAGTRNNLTLFVPKQVLGPDGNATFGCWA